jgi:hypothetical protein
MLNEQAHSVNLPRPLSVAVSRAATVTKMKIE